MTSFEGIRVLDLTHVLACPFATCHLAVLGVDVIRSAGQSGYGAQGKRRSCPQQE